MPLKIERRNAANWVAKDTENQGEVCKTKRKMS